MVFPLDHELHVAQNLYLQVPSIVPGTEELNQTFAEKRNASGFYLYAM